VWAGGSVKSVGDEIAERSSKRGGREGGRRDAAYVGCGHNI